MARSEKRQQKAQRKQERKLGIKPESDELDEETLAGLGIGPYEDKSAPE
jgi:hypothetical protein